MPLLSVRSPEQVGEQPLLAIEPRLAPGGRPDTERVTACVAPATSVLVIVFEPLDPATILMSSLAESE